MYFNKIIDCIFRVKPWRLLLLCWMFLPGGMFVVAWVGESRMLPLGVEQSLMFFPGDFMLGFLIMGIAILFQAEVGSEWIWPRKYSWIIATAIMTLALFILLRYADGSRYELRALMSPTKMYHDITGYIVFVFLLILRGVPQSVWMIAHGSILKQKSLRRAWILIFVSGGIYITLAVVDTLTFKPEYLAIRHVTDWVPLWG